MNLDDFIKEMEEENKKRSRFLNWMDSWFGGGIAGYRVTYILIRPHILVKECMNQTKWALQRVFRGWDNRVLWSIDYWLDDIMPEILMRFKETNHGIPMFCFTEIGVEQDRFEYSDEEHARANELWDNILEEMIKGFRASKALKDLEFKNRDQYIKESEILEKQRLDGMILFVKHYNDLWD